ncbi:hypothetical protein D3C78_780490 [compost metagenome]
MLQQRGDLSGALAKRGNADGHHVQSIVQVSTEQPLPYSLSQVMVGGAYDSDIYFAQFKPTHWYEPLLLDNLQKLDLKRQRKIANFVKEQRSVIRQL